jgi:hypothetical protein
VIWQAISSALLAVCTLALFKGLAVATNRVRTRRQRNQTAAAAGFPVGEAGTPDPLDRSRQRHEQLVTNLRQTM